MPDDRRRRAQPMEIRYEVAIAAPRERVFEFLADTRNFPVVDRALVEFEPHQRMVLGLEGTFVHRRGGMKARTTWHVAELETPSRIRVGVSGAGYEMEETANLATTDAGTIAAFVDSVWATSLAGRLMVALSGRIMRRDLEQRAALLKAALEQAAAEDGVAGRP